MAKFDLSRSSSFAASAAALCLGFQALTTAPAAAGGLWIAEFKAGVLAHDVPDLWSGFQREPDAVDINLEVMFRPNIPLLIGGIYPAIGASISTSGATSHVYADARWQVETPVGLFFAIGLGVAVHDGELEPVLADRKALGSRALFHIPAEVGLRLGDNSLSVYFEHISNGEFADFNEGLDRLGVRYGYRF
ncbi:MAG: acyloxyacyl hydrolase [Hyphomicrobiaceae bacterium]